MATPYETVYNRFLQKCTDYDLPKLPDDELESMLHGWMTSAIVRFVQSNSDLSQRDDELRTFLVDLEDYEKEVIALFMVVAWLEPRINLPFLSFLMCCVNGYSCLLLFVHSLLYSVTV